MTKNPIHSKKEQKTEKQVQKFSKNLKLNLDETKVSTRLAFGQALVKIGQNQKDLVVLDAEMSNSTYTSLFAEQFPERFLQSFIAEQNMVSVAVGLSLIGKIPVLATFGAFLTRAFDQIRMSQYSLPKIDLNIAGSHAGVSIGEDGPSQMALEDLAIFRTLRQGLVFYPSEATSTYKLLSIMLENKGIKYLRLTRKDTYLLYTDLEEFSIGGSKILRSLDENLVCQSQKEVLKNWLSENNLREKFTIELQEKIKKAKKTKILDEITIVCAGITVFEALQAWESLAKLGIVCRVIDLYTVKPVDKKTLLQASKQTKAILVVEDHYPEGGLFSAVLEALASEKIFQENPDWLGIFSLAVTKIPQSGKPAELLADQKIDATAIISKVQEILAIQT